MILILNHSSFHFSRSGASPLAKNLKKFRPVHLDYPAKINQEFPAVMQVMDSLLEKARNFLLRKRYFLNIIFLLNFNSIFRTEKKKQVDALVDQYPCQLLR